MTRNKSKWTKIVALVIVGAMVFSVVATGLMMLFMGGKSVIGVYADSDGKKIVLGKNGVATLMLPTGESFGAAKYEVDGNTVLIKDIENPSADPNAVLELKISGDDLVSGSGKQAQTWSRQ
ncbi:MAG: hypothetical protein CVT63_03180 [Candidatus Anoxymicrobium japonicum]|uniref:Uncharacterized protein n=1 Tax=Candidatus Anoxymicrobium japonicum TaxID=2013648 RepID=A0A2N3G6N0_9ACTN|nr:MAG: hypothetical protein CVT63_03180 [Candidatus Anoxymicrobium japonicum]